MHADDFKKILPGNADLHGALFDETDSSDEDPEQLARSISPNRSDIKMDENASQLVSIMETDELYNYNRGGKQQGLFVRGNSKLRQEAQHALRA